MKKIQVSAVVFGICFSVSLSYASGHGSCTGEAKVVMKQGLLPSQREIIVIPGTIECKGDTLGEIPKRFLIISHSAPERTAGQRLSESSVAFTALKTNERFRFEWSVSHGMSLTGVVRSSSLSLHGPLVEEKK
jgi:hypothetical protein